MPIVALLFKMRNRSRFLGMLFTFQVSLPVLLGDSAQLIKLIIPSATIYFLTHGVSRKNLANVAKRKIDKRKHYDWERK